MILTLVPEVDADTKGGDAEPASPFLLVYVAVSRRRETGAFVAGDLALSGVHAYTCSPAKVAGRAGPVFKDVLAGLKGVQFTFPRRPQEAFSVCFV